MSFLSIITKSKGRRPSRIALFLAAFVIGATFLWDWLTPLGYAVWLLYLAAVVLVSFTARRRSAYVVAMICTFLIVAGFFLSPPGINVSISIFNRLVGTGTLWIVAILMEILSRNEHLVRESEERYHTLFNTMKEGFCILEVIFDEEYHAVDCRLGEVNPAFTVHTGWHNAQGKRLRDLAPDLEAYWFEMYGKVALTGESEHFENKAMMLNRFFEVSAYSVGGPGSYKVAVFFNDITERKRTEEALKQSNKQLAERTEELTEKIEQLKVETAERVQAMEALHQKEQMLLQQGRLAAMGEMIGNIAHQWRQPLNILGLTIQELKACYEHNDFTKEFLDESITSSMALIQHMSKTIDDFKNYFKPDKEKLDFNVHETIVTTIALLAPTLKAKSIDVEVKVIGEPTIHGYHNEFAQVLLNILKNAIDVFSERGTPDPKLTITAVSEEGHCIVTITDNAGGISEEIIDKIFDPYFTTKSPQLGTGIGLYMSKTIIEKNMGGRLTVCNMAQGAQFMIEV